MPKNLSICLAFMFLGGCQFRPITNHPTPAPSRSPTMTQPGRLNNTTMVEIKNDWNGYSDITPIVRHYKLKPQAGALTGNGYFAVGGYGAYDIHQQYTKTISIPTPIANQFFHKLGETKMLSSSQYQPVISRADDYPAITIHLTAPQRDIVFFSSSQGSHHIPWQIKTQEKGVKKYYVSQSAAPDQALALLKPYIDHPGLEQVINRRHQPQPQGKPTAHQNP